MTSTFTPEQRAAIGPDNITPHAALDLIQSLRADRGSIVPPAVLADALEEIAVAINVLAHASIHTPLVEAACGTANCPYAGD